MPFTARVPASSNCVQHTERGPLQGACLCHRPRGSEQSRAHWYKQQQVLGQRSCGNTSKGATTETSGAPSASQTGNDAETLVVDGLMGALGVVFSVLFFGQAEMLFMLTWLLRLLPPSLYPTDFGYYSSVLRFTYPLDTYTARHSLLDTLAMVSYLTSKLRTIFHHLFAWNAHRFFVVLYRMSLRLKALSMRLRWYGSIRTHRCGRHRTTGANTLLRARCCQA